MPTTVLKDLLHQGVLILRGCLPWMGWNMLLALIPLVLSVYLFRRSAGSNGRPENSLKRSGINSRLLIALKTPLWWAGVLIFIAFLPNAPYILTDVIHLNRYILSYNSLWVTGFIIVPLFTLFIGSGFLTYALSVINVGYYLHKQGHGRWIPVTEVVLHLLCAIGVFVGRFPRLNSWYFVTQPGHVVRTMLHTLLSPAGFLGVIVGFVIITGLYIPTKEVVLAVASYRKKRSISVI